MRSPGDDGGMFVGGTKRSPRRLGLTLGALLSAMIAAAAACGGGGGGSKSTSGTSGNEGKPKYGGKIVYGLEAKTGGGGYCLPRAQLAIAGIEVADTIYDTLTVPTAKADVFVPYLAKAVDHDPTYTTWTITLRPGIKFHDGTPLDANAVRLNIDKWRQGTLLNFVFQNVADVSVQDPMTVLVRMKTPWVAFPAYLWATGRTGIAAPAQINNNATCETDLIGTGPFKLKSINPQSGDVDVVKNPDYWRKGYPYLDEIQFKVQGDGQQRRNGLQGGQFDVIHDTGGLAMDNISSFAGVKMDIEPPGYREVAHTLLNVSKPPLDDVNVRRALVMAGDKNALNQIANKGKATLADQLFDSKVVGHVSDPGYPKENLAEAKRLVDQYKATHGGRLTFQVQSTFDTTVQALAQAAQRQAAKAGINVQLPAPVDQATIINEAIGAKVDAFAWRNYPGSDPDTMYVWFHSNSTVNFNHINDPQMDKDLEMGRVEPDPAKRKALYEDFNKRMSSQAYNVWEWYADWIIAHKDNVHGIVGPNLPDASGNPGSQKPAAILAGWHLMLGMWVS